MDFVSERVGIFVPSTMILALNSFSASSASPGKSIGLTALSTRDFGLRVSDRTGRLSGLALIPTNRGLASFHSARLSDWISLCFPFGH
jgi:hypothetical protein